MQNTKKEYSYRGKYCRAGAAAISERLSGKDTPVLLFELTSLADEAARACGMRRADLFDSLWDYTPLLPPGWRASWLTAGEGHTGLVMAVPAGWSGKAPEPSLTTSLVGDASEWRLAGADEFQSLV